MNDNSQDDLRDLYEELTEAYEGFLHEVYRATPKWQYGMGRRRIFHPRGPYELARIYRAILLTAFAAGVILSVVGSQVIQGLGISLIVGSLFGFGAWMAQAWNLSMAELYRITNQLVSEFQLPPVSPSRMTAADLAHELNLNQPDAKYYAAQIKTITNRIEDMGRHGRPDSNG